MKIGEKILTGLAVVAAVLGVSSIESTPIIIPLLLIAGGGAWLVYIANAYKWE